MKSIYLFFCFSACLCLTVSSASASEHWGYPDYSKNEGNIYNKYLFLLVLLN